MYILVVNTYIIQSAPTRMTTQETQIDRQEPTEAPTIDMWHRNVYSTRIIYCVFTSVHLLLQYLYGWMCFVLVWVGISILHLRTSTIYNAVYIVYICTCKYICSARRWPQGWGFKRAEEMPLRALIQTADAYVMHIYIVYSYIHCRELCSSTSVLSARAFSRCPTYLISRRLAHAMQCARYKPRLVPRESGAAHLFSSTNTITHRHHKHCAAHVSRVRGCWLNK